MKINILKTFLAIGAITLCNQLGQCSVPADAVLWLKADAGISKDGNGRVTTWADQSGNGNDAAQADTALRPLWVSNGLNGLPVVRFDTNLMTTAHMAVTGTNGFTWVYVMRQNDTKLGYSEDDAWQCHLWEGNDSTSEGYTPAYFGGPVGSHLTAGWGSSANASSTDEISSNSVYMGIATYDGETHSFYVNGTLVGTAPQTDSNLAGLTNTDAATVSIGAFIGQKRFAFADIAEIIVYDRALSTLDLNEVQDYLRHKYSLICPSAPVLWLKADAGVIADENSRVSTWQDQSGHNNHATQTDGELQPQWISNGLNGQPVLRFSSNVMHTATMAITGTNAFTWVYVIRQNDSTLYDLFQCHLWQGEDSTSGGYSPAYFSGPMQLTAGWGSSDGYVSMADDITDDHVYMGVATYDGATHSFYLNGQLVGTNSKSDSDFSTEGNVTIGAFMWDNLFALADFAEVIVYDRALNESELMAMNTYLEHKYSLAFASAGPVVWLKADAGSVVDGSGRVVQWQDQSGYGNHATQTQNTNRPAWLNNELNGQSVLRFSSNSMHTANMAVIGTNAFTWIYVIRQNDSMLYDLFQCHLWQGEDSTTGGYTPAYFGGPVDSKLSAGWGSSDGYVSMSDDISNNSVYVGIATFDGATQNFYMNGVLVGTNSKSDSNFPTEGNVTVGAFMQDNLFALADFAEVIVYNRALNESELSDVQSYLATKYSLSFP